MRVEDLAAAESLIVAVGNKFCVLDATDPTSLTLLATLDVSGLQVVLRDDLAVIAAGVEGLHIVDVSTPTAPRLVGTYAEPGYSTQTSDMGSFFTPELGVTGVAVANSTAFICDRNLKLLDISDPEKPLLVGSYETLSWGRRVAVAGSIACVAFIFSGPMLFDVSQPEAPQPLGLYMSHTLLPEIVAENGLAYIVSMRGSLAESYKMGVEVVDIADPLFPKQRGLLELPGQVLAMIMHESYIYAVVPQDPKGVRPSSLTTKGPFHIQVFDVSDPDRPRDAGKIRFKD
jgi:hypothetical protein